MFQRALNIFTEKMEPPTTGVSSTATVLSVIGFLASFFFAVVGLVAWKDGSWVLFLAGAVLLTILVYFTTGDDRSPSYQYCSARLIRAMVSGVITPFLFAAIGLSLKYAYSLYDDHTAAAAASLEQAYKASPEKYVEKVIGRDDIHASFVKNDERISIAYDLDPWSLTGSSARTTYNLHVSQLVPAIFARFPDAKTIEVVGRGEFRDKRGNSSRDDVVKITFSRKNSQTIQWGNIRYDDVPELADWYWIHPSARN